LLHDKLLELVDGCLGHAELLRQRLLKGVKFLQSRVVALQLLQQLQLVPQAMFLQCWQLPVVSMASVGSPGLEPGTRRLGACRSDQLSYGPKAGVTEART